MLQIRDAQKSALIDAVQNLDSERAGNAIYQVLQQRHIQERVQLEEQFNREIATAKAEARAQMAETRQAEREELIAEQGKVRKLNLQKAFCKRLLISSLVIS